MFLIYKHFYSLFDVTNTVNHKNHAQCKYQKFLSLFALLIVLCISYNYIEKIDMYNKISISTCSWQRHVFQHNMWSTNIYLNKCKICIYSSELCSYLCLSNLLALKLNECSITYFDITDTSGFFPCKFIPDSLPRPEHLLELFCQSLSFLSLNHL